MKHLMTASGLGLASVLALSGCASDEPAAQAKQVVTMKAISEGADSSPSATTGTDAERPRERLDMTDEERSQLDRRYDDCLLAHGYDENAPDVQGKAGSACAAKEPLPPWELDTANPRSADFLHAVVQCLREKGVANVHESEPAEGRRMLSLGGVEGDSSITKNVHLMPVCEKEVAAKGIGR